MNQYQQAKINDSCLITFDSGTPKSLQTKINSTLKLKPENSQDKNIQIYISSYMCQYDLYSGNSLRALESEIKSSIKISINKNDKVTNKTLMSIKRFGSIELTLLQKRK